MAKQTIIPVLVLASLLAGCGVGQVETSVAAAECVAPLRFEDKVYNEMGNTTEAPTRKLGVAEKATCINRERRVDVSFPEKPNYVTVWAYDGVDPAVAIGARHGTGDFVVLFAEEVPRSKAKRIADRLS